MIQKRKKLLYTLLSTVLLISILWISGGVPKLIGKTVGTRYVNKHFPEMALRYANIEWSPSHDDYIISFVDKKENRYSFCIGPKDLPIYPGQGIFGLEEEYRIIKGKE